MTTPTFAEIAVAKVEVVPNCLVYSFSQKAPKGTKGKHFAFVLKRNNAESLILDYIVLRLDTRNRISSGTALTEIRMLDPTPEAFPRTWKKYLRAERDWEGVEFLPWDRAVKSKLREQANTCDDQYQYIIREMEEITASERIALLSILPPPKNP
jgi:hypothetical protein